jgi:nitrite reductase/ring-hydroxylating ferredoxin subunit
MSYADGMIELRRTQHVPGFGLPAAWWPVALGSRIAGKPVAARLGDKALAHWRDTAGTVHAVEDRCPHRRVPLSMGWVTEEGWIQCPYHGWCFEGGTGQCVKIPNLGAHERVSASIKVDAFTTIEGASRALRDLSHLAAPARDDSAPIPADYSATRFETAVADGFVHVWTGDTLPQPAPVSAHDVDAAGRVAGEPFEGEMEARAPFEVVADALAWNPGKALGMGFMFGAGDQWVDPETEVDEAAGLVSIRRNRLTFDLPRASTFEPISQRTTDSTVTMRVDTGLARVEAADPGGRFVARVLVGLTPLGPYRTMVRWHGAVEGRGSRGLATVSRALQGLRRRTGRSADAMEGVADETESVVDPALTTLRALRAATPV